MVKEVLKDSVEIHFAVPSAKRYHNQYYENHPASFVNFSITGTSCACNCEHCNTKLLKTMLPVNTPQLFREEVRRLKERGCTGILVSGGADQEGKVPLKPFLEVIGEAVEAGFQVVVHSGILDHSTALGLKNAGVHHITMDIIGDITTIREVYHLAAKPLDYLESMLICSELGLSFSPHVVIGLHFGQIKGEYRALEMIAQTKPDNIVLVILTPMKKTGMADIQPPLLQEVGLVMEAAVEAAKDSSLALGCARPPGTYKREIEKKAVDLGFSTIAYPDESTVRYCLEQGLRPIFFESCCCLAAQHNII